MENCTALKYKVQDLINDGKLKFEDWDKLVEVKDSSKTKVEMPKQKEETLNEINFGEATMPNEKVPIVEVRKSEKGSSTTTKGSKERPCKLDKKEEKKKALQELA